MEIKPQILTAKVMHKRTFPKVNQFTYSIYYLVLPLRTLVQLECLKINRPGIISVQEKDYGARDGSSINDWATDILRENGLENVVENILFITMPRILGYGFNPVSFYLCLDKNGELRALISEVHNTFGESHSYLAAHEDQRPILKEDWLEAEKLFHVSPFLTRDGSYRFRIASQEDKLGIWIDYVNPDGKTQLLTTLNGKLSPLTRSNLWKHFFLHPLVTLKSILLIHWQALKLFRKGIRYLVKPKQRQETISLSRNLTKM